MVTASLVKELREKTGAGMMDCKKVLTETDGDMEKAIELLRERGIAKAAKKSGRVAAEGLVEAYISEDGKVGAIVEVNSETDFVAKNEEFKAFVMDVAKQVVEKNPKDVEELLNQEAIFEAGKTVNEALIGKIATIGENLSIRRFARFESKGLEKTGAGMMDCKKVLTETDGDMEKAIELLRERGIAKAAKKSGRVAAEGLVEAYISEDGKVGAIVEVNSETDFVAKNEEFKAFVMDVAKQVVEKNPKDVEELLNQEAIFEAGKTVNEALIGKIATIGENLSIRRFARFESKGLIEKYIHGDGKIAVLVNMTKGDKELAKDLCMQIAAARPEFVTREEVPQERVDKEMEILKVQAMNEGKPESSS